MESVLLIVTLSLSSVKSIGLMEEIPYHHGVLSVTSCHWNTFQVSTLSQACLDQLPPPGSSASLTTGYCGHQQNYCLELHLPMLENWSQKSGISSEGAAVTEAAQVSADSPVSGCSSVL